MRLPPGADKNLTTYLTTEAVFLLDEAASRWRVPRWRVADAALRLFSLLLLQEAAAAERELAIPEGALGELLDRSELAAVLTRPGAAALADFPAAEAAALAALRELREAGPLAAQATLFRAVQRTLEAPEAADRERARAVLEALRRRGDAAERKGAGA